MILSLNEIQLILQEKDILQNFIEKLYYTMDGLIISEDV
jgi:hypothetical protein